jgi:hypothetical protein
MFRLPRDYRDVEIDRPIFLLGNQGDGVTLISRFLRRNRSVVCVSGNSLYWTGADEMQRAMEYRLPRRLRLSGRLLGTDPPHRVFSQPRSWSYGVDELFQKYHLTEDDWTEGEEQAFRRIIRECLAQYGLVKGPRFVDKSQVFTLKTRFIQRLLSGCSPQFILITRDPYVSCFRAASGKAKDMSRYARFLSFEERFRYCIQHWKNCMDTVIKDSVFLESFSHFRYEDFLLEPEAQTRRLCQLIDLEYDPDMLPAAHHTMPLGTKFGNRWYPLRPENNETYLKKMTEAQLDQVEAQCGTLAKRFGYCRPELAGTKSD